MQRLVLLICSLLFLSGGIVACSSNNSTNGEKSNNELANTEEKRETTVDISNIELRSHDFDEAEEEVDDLTDRESDFTEDKTFIKSGKNLTLPAEFPNDFPIAEGMTLDSISVKTSGESGESNIEAWFNDGGKYTLEELKALYKHYIENNGFTDVEIKDFDHYVDELTSYEGSKGEILYVVGISPKDDYNVITLNYFENHSF